MTTPAQIQEQLRHNQQDLRDEVDAMREKLGSTQLAQRGAELLDEASQRAQEVAESAEQQVERAQEAARQAVGKVRTVPLVLTLVGVAAAVAASTVWVVRRRRGATAPSPAEVPDVEGDVPSYDAP